MLLRKPVRQQQLVRRQLLERPVGLPILAVVVPKLNDVASTVGRRCGVVVELATETKLVDVVVATDPVEEAAVVHRAEEVEAVLDEAAEEDFHRTGC